MTKNPKHKQLRSLEHLRFVRSQPCAIRGYYHICSGPMQSAHLRVGTDGGTGKKPSDNFTIPLCAKAHALQHSIGEKSFEKRFGIDGLMIAGKLWIKSPANKSGSRASGQ